MYERSRRTSRIPLAKLETATATLAVVNARIWIGPECTSPSANALAASGQTILAVGSEEDIRKRCSPLTRFIDAKGSLVVPGFIDCHIHLLMGGERLISVQLSDCPSKEEFVRRIKEHALTRKKGEWITGGDWDHESWADSCLPDRAWIDQVTPHNPVWLNRKEGHQYLANTLALKLVGLDRNNIPQVEGGTVEKDASGRATGLFKDNALRLVYPKIPAPTQRESAMALEAATRYCLMNGVTSIHHMTEPHDRNRGGRGRDLEVYTEAHKKGRLGLRVYVATPLKTWQELDDHIEAHGRGDEFLRVGALKGYVDGSLGSHSAAFFEPYTDQPSFRGTTVNSPEDLFKWISQADRKGLQVVIHAIGDRACNTILNIYAKVEKDNGKRDRRFRIEHAQHLVAADIPRFKKLGVIPSCQPYHAIDDGRFAERMLGGARVKQGTYAFKSLLAAGASLAFGSDWFVAPPSPLIGIHAATHRVTLAPGAGDRRGPTAFTPHERISVLQALTAYTSAAAYSVHEEAVKGALRPGMLCDMAFINTPLLAPGLTERRLAGAKCTMTVLGGEVVWDARVGWPEKRSKSSSRLVNSLGQLKSTL